MCRMLKAMSLGLALAVGMASVALAEDHPAWDPSVGYNPHQLDTALEKAKKEAPQAFAPSSVAPGSPAGGASGNPAQPASRVWDPYDPRSTASVGN